MNNPVTNMLEHRRSGDIDNYPDSSSSATEVITQSSIQYTRRHQQETSTVEALPTNNSTASSSQSHCHPIPQQVTQSHLPESSDISVQKKMTKCRFFFSERGCSKGDMCTFSHDVDDDVEIEGSASSPQNTSTGHTKTTRNRPVCKFYTSGYCKWGSRCGFFHAKTGQDVQTPIRINSKTQKLDKKLSELTEQELSVMRKTEITQLKKRFPKRKDIKEGTYHLVFKPSDPDWPFDVKLLSLEFTFPQLYPKHILSASIFEEGCLPTTLVKHIIKKMNDWLTDRHETCQKNDKIELVFRPFLRWLDKTAEQLFTDGLTMYKKELAAKAAGFTFVHHTEKKSETQADSAESPAAGSGDDVTSSLSTITIQERETEDEESSPYEELSQAAAAKSSQNQACGRLSPARRGTELRLRNLRLTESAATLHCSILKTGIRCSRCKTVHHITMHPEKPYVVVCDKCRSKMSLIYHAGLMHMSSSTAGFFDLNGCLPFDLILQDCQFVASCLECSKEQLVHGLHADQEKTFWCINCHKKMCIAVERGSFILLNEGAAIKLGADAVLISKKAKAKSEFQKILSEGKELPDRGTCAHYKKSYRWFRFPCCGKLYPCDTCHNEKETDHEMEMANRMICGYCSKEQGFSLTKPCISCDSSMTRAKSQHWEGGQGCRNKIHMAKGDKQKFSGSSKTVSRKADALKKKTGKKTTHIRHAV